MSGVIHGRRIRGSALALALAIAAMGSASACSSTPTPAVESQPVESPPSIVVAGTGGTLVPIDSDNVDMAGYDATSQVMTVLFDSGGLYEYYGVPLRLWEDFFRAQPDPWSKVGYPQLVQRGYAYREINP